MSEIPLDAKILMNEFLAQQKRDEQRRAEEKQEALRRGNDVAANKPMRAKEIQRYARTLGFSVEDGRGRHGVHLVSPDGRECPLPIHGGGRTLANGTQRSIVSFINQNGIPRG